MKYHFLIVLSSPDGILKRYFDTMKDATINAARITRQIVIINSYSNYDEK